MDVLLISEYFLPKISGIEISLKNIGNSLIEKGHNVTILTRRYKETLKKYEELSSGIIVKRYDFDSDDQSFFHSKRVLKKVEEELNNELKTKNYNLIIVRDPVSALAVSNLNIKNSVFIPGSLEMKLFDGFDLSKGIIENVKLISRYVKMKYYHSFERKAIKSDIRIMTYSQIFKNEIIETEKPKYEIIVNKPGISKNYRYTDTESIANEFKIKPEDFIFLYLGRIVNVKGVDIILEAFHELDLKNSKLIIVGDGDQLENIKNLNSRLKNKEQVIFTGKRYDTPSFYSLADYSVSASKYETFGFVILESLGCGTPVIGYKKNEPHVLVAFDEIIHHGNNGIHIDEYGKLGMKKAMLKAYNNGKISLKERNRISSDAKNKYSWDRFSKLIIEEIIRKE